MGLTIAFGVEKVLKLGMDEGGKFAGEFIEKETVGSQVGGRGTFLGGNGSKVVLQSGEKGVFGSRKGHGQSYNCPKGAVECLSR